MIGGGRPLVLLLLLAPACANLAEQAAADRDEVAGSAEARLGTRPSAEVPLNPTAHREALRERLREPLTEATAVEIALLHGPELRAAFARLGVARADLAQAGLAGNPVLAGDAKFFSSGTEVELSLTQSFLDLLYVPLRRAVASAELAAAKAELTRRVVRIAFDVRRAYAQLAAAERILELHREALAAAEASQELMRLLHAAGNVIDARLTAEEVAAARARLDLAASELAVAEAREPLNVMLGLSGSETEWTLAERLRDDVAGGFDRAQLETQAIAASLDLAELRGHADAAAQRGGLADWESWLAGSELGLAAKKEVGDSSWGLGPSLAIPLPLFDRGQGPRLAAQAELRALLHRQAGLAVEIRAAARRLRARSEHAAMRAAYLAGIALPLQQRLVRETIRDYNAMQIGVFDVLDAKRRHLELACDGVRALRDAWLARYDLHELLAGSLNRGRLGAGSDGGDGGDMAEPDGGHSGHR